MPVTPSTRVIFDMDDAQGRMARARSDLKKARVSAEINTADTGAVPKQIKRIIKSTPVSDQPLNIPQKVPDKPIKPIVMRALGAGGGMLVIAPVPGAGGDYFGDLGHVYDLAPAFVVSLTSAAELYAAGASQLGQHIQDKGTRWVQLPIPDFGVPDHDFALAWPEVSSRLRRALLGGGRVLVHCKGGCGRSGMVALRLMIEAGEEPQTALSRLRQVHPQAIETEEQMRWALAAEQGATLSARPSDSAVRRAIGITNASPQSPSGSMPPPSTDPGRRAL